MGGADIIPGVSGGTVALVLGIYQRLITAISHCDLHLVGLLARRRWTEAARHIDLRFLIALGLGIATGIVSLASLMHYLLAYQRPYTLAAFFGMIAASACLVARMLKPRSNLELAGLFAIGAGAAWFAFWITGHTQIVARTSLGYAFLSGSVAICAMILPGISGAYILVLLGMYQVITELIVKVRRFEAGTDEFVLLIVFASGCVIGLVTFSKALRLLLTRFEAPTLAALCGFMVGSLRCVWPFQIDLTPEIEKLKLKRYELYLPREFDQQVWLCGLIAVACGVAVLAVESMVRGQGHSAGSSSSEQRNASILSPQNRQRR